MIPSIEWIDNKVKMIDQTLLPHELKFLEFDDYRDVATSIKVMNIRGAPAIGVAAAMGLALATLEYKALPKETFLKKFSELNLPPISFVGHGIGLHLHEEPYLGGKGETLLESGMVLGVEPLVYGWGRGFGLQIKDMVLVTSEGCEVLSDRTANDELITIT